MGTSIGNRRGSTLTASSADGYSEEVVAELLFMLEEEKVAGDVYEALYAQTELSVFDNISRSEDRHFNTLLDLATALGLDVSDILALPSGSFVDPELQTLYDTLIAQSSGSDADALAVGVLIEETDIADLQAASASIPGTTLAGVYDRLMSASYNHLDAFETALGEVSPTVVAAWEKGAAITVTYIDGTFDNLQGARLAQGSDSAGDLVRSQAVAADYERLSALVDRFGDESGAPEEATFTGSAAADANDGTDGSDSLVGRGGDDTLSGGLGDDTLVGNRGNDVLSGGLGRDSLSGGAGDDILAGNGWDDALMGNVGRDVLRGGRGDDHLDGGAGRDMLFGGSGADMMIGGSGRDRYWGGAAADTFVIDKDGATDVVHDFENGIDLIDLSDFALSGIVALTAAAVQDGLNVRIDLDGGDVLRIDNISMSELTAGDFQF